MIAPAVGFQANVTSDEEGAVNTTAFVCQTIFTNGYFDFQFIIPVQRKLRKHYDDVLGVFADNHKYYYEKPK